MAQRKCYIGSTGPFLYDDAGTYGDGINYVGFRAEESFIETVISAIHKIMAAVGNDAEMIMYVNAVEYLRISALSGGNAQIKAQNELILIPGVTATPIVTIGDGTAGTDYMLKFNGENSDFEIQQFEDENELRLGGDVSSGHYVAIEADGTVELNGNATVWEDLNFDPTRSGGPAATRPDDVTINNVFHKEFTSANNQLCGSVQEIPHAHKLSGTIYPHIHIFLKSGESAGTTGVTFTFYWELRQAAGTTSGSVSLAATSAQLTASGTHKFDIYDGTGFTGPTTKGAQLAVVIARTAGDAGDVVVLTYGVHFEVDTPGGSRALATK